jgi:hypothetical protein
MKFFSFQLVGHGMQRDDTNPHVDPNERLDHRDVLCLHKDSRYDSRFTKELLKNTTGMSLSGKNDKRVFGNLFCADPTLLG